MIPVDIATPLDDWNHPVIIYWLSLGARPSVLRAWGWKLPEKK